MKTMAAISIATIVIVGMFASCDTSTEPVTQPMNTSTTYDPNLIMADILNPFFAHIATTTTTTIPRQSTPRTPMVIDGNVWDALAQCECGGNWGCNTGNGYFGGLQFAASSWNGFGGTEFAPMAHMATREQQIVVGERILARMGWGAWPGCARKLGLR